MVMGRVQQSKESIISKESNISKAENQLFCRMSNESKRHKTSQDIYFTGQGMVPNRKVNQ